MAKTQVKAKTNRAVTRYAPEMKDKAIEAYNAGSSVPKLAEEMKINPTTFYGWLKASKKKSPAPKKQEQGIVETIKSKISALQDQIHQLKITLADAILK